MSRPLSRSTGANVDGELRISVGRLHEGQKAAYSALLPFRFKALRCGRRFGKTELAKSWIKQGLVQGEPCAWFAPQHMQSLEVFYELTNDLSAIVDESSKAAGVMRVRTGGESRNLHRPSASRSATFGSKVRLSV